jgi:hypothetical protein
MKKWIGIPTSDCLAAVTLLAMAAATTQLLGQNKSDANISSPSVDSKSNFATELRIERIGKTIPRNRKSPYGA